MSCMIQPGDTMRVPFHVKVANGDYEVLSDADSLPTGALWREGVIDTDVTVQIQHRATGKYVAIFTIPGGYSAGDMCAIEVTYSAGGVAGQAEILEFFCLVGVDFTDGASLGLSRLDVAVSTRVSEEDVTPTRAAALDTLIHLATMLTASGNNYTFTGDALKKLFSDVTSMDGYSLEQAIRLLLAAAIGTDASTSPNARDYHAGIVGSSKSRVKSTRNASGKRQVTLIDPTP